MSAGSDTVAALEAMWSAIQKNHPGLPDVMIITGNGESGSSLIWGHFHASQWNRKEEEKKRLHELFISGQRLQTGARLVLQTMLHEATHAECHEAGIKDTRATSVSYHTKAFAEQAATFGLTFSGDPHPKQGYSQVRITEETADLYAPEIAALEAAIRVFRAAGGLWAVATAPGGEPGVDGGGDGETLKRTRKPGVKDRNNLKLVCDCGRFVRASRKTFEEGALFCGLCTSAFEVAL